MTRVRPSIVSLLAANPLIAVQALDYIEATQTEMIPMARPARTQISAKGEAPRAWQRMLSGRRLDLLDPSPLDIEIEDIAHGLARVARWNGQTIGAHAFSVAQHSLVVEDICRKLAPGWDKPNAG